MRISDWSSDVCSSDLALVAARFAGEEISDLGIAAEIGRIGRAGQVDALLHPMGFASEVERTEAAGGLNPIAGLGRGRQRRGGDEANAGGMRSEEHTSELQSLMLISYAVLRLKKKTDDRIN